MTSRQRRVVSLVFLGLFLVIGIQVADADRLQRVQDRMEPTEHVAAIAALEPVGESTGWGRIVVRDERRTTGVEHSVKLWLFGMEPYADLVIRIQGVELAMVTTDGDGYAGLSLHSQGKASRELAEALPSARNLESVTVLDATKAAVLEGTFTVIRRSGEDLLHYERIALEDVTGGEATGVAAVAQSDSDEQGFFTRASGLVPGLSYQVVVDGFRLAVLTADLEGQAALEMTAPAEENPLPSEVLPVSAVRIVEWYLGEDLQLWGAFSGDPDCQKLRGEVLEVTDEGFVIRVGSHRILVVVTDETRFENLGDGVEIDDGDVVVVEGCWDGEALVADWILLAEDDDEPECEKLRGEVLEVGEDRLVVSVGSHRVSIAVTDETRFEDFELLSDLRPGDVLVVEGCWREEVLVAEWILLAEEAGEPECEEFEGTIQLIEGDEILLHVTHAKNWRRVAIKVTRETEFKEFEELSELGEGDVVAVEGCWREEVLVADWILLVEKAEEPECDELRGVIDEIGADQFVLHVTGVDTKNRIMVKVTRETEFKEFEEFSELGEGDVVVVEGCWREGVLVADWVLLAEKAEEPECEELRGTVQAVGVDEFVVLVAGKVIGRRIVVEVTDETEFEGFERLSDLGEGDTVAFEGCWDGDLLVAWWVVLVERAEEPDCVGIEGAVIRIGVDEILLDVGEREIVVEVPGDTVFKDFEQLSDLGEGDVVDIEGCWEGDLLIASWIRLLEDADAPEWWQTDGTVTEVFEDGFALNTGEEILRVFVGDGTEYRGIDGVGGLGVGDFVFVEGPCDGESLEAAVVKLIEAAD